MGRKIVVIQLFDRLNVGAKSKHDVSPTMRRILLDGLREMARKKGKTLTQVCQEWWEEDWQAAAKALASFQVRHVDASVNVNHQLPDTLLEFAKAYAKNEKGVEIEGELAGGTIPSLQDLEREPKQVCN